MSRSGTPPRTDVCVLIPAFNESLSIERVVKSVRERGYPAVVIDDGSKDRTADLARRAGAEVLTQAENRGKGAAIRRGFDWFLSRQFRALVLMDADGQHDPDDLDRLIAPVLDGRYDLAAGTRMSETRNMPPVRVATNRFMSWLISAVAHQHIPDTQCGYRALSRDLVDRLSLKTDRFETETEMLFEAGRLGFRIGSVPVRTVYAGEKSRVRPVRDTLRFFSYLAKYLAEPKTKS